MLTYTLGAEREIFEKSSIFIEEVATGIFGVRKTNCEEIDYSISSDAVIQLFNDKNKKVALKSNEKIRINFQLND